MRRRRVRRIPAALLLTAAAATTAVACGTQSGSSPPSTRPPTQGTTVTSTVTAQPTAPPPAPTATAPRPTAPPPGSTSSAPRQPGAVAKDPSSVVRQYFDAINARDYRAAWALGGKNLGSSYSAFVHGFADTASDSVTILGAGGPTVRVNLDSLQSDGSVKRFTGTYTVRDGVIASASVHEVTAAQPSSPPSTQPSSPSSGSSSAAHYDNCSDAHAAGRFSIPQNDPAYAPHLDADHDGLACEPHESPSH